MSEKRLLWLPELGIGYLDAPVPADLYGGGYFQHYRELDATPTGAALTKSRLAFVHRHYHGPITDVGIGGGRFVLEHGNATGWDINPSAVRWLRENRLLLDPTSTEVAGVTMFDSIEHIENPSAVLDNVASWCFISTPIYANGEAVEHSKHRKVGEHLWYFTERGLICLMQMHGFRLVEANRDECDLGRDSIGSYAFRRSRPCK